MQDRAARLRLVVPAPPTFATGTTMNWTRTRLERFTLAACAALLIAAPGAVGQQTSDQPARLPSVQQQAKAKRADIYHEKTDARQVIAQAVVRAHKNTFPSRPKTRATGLEILSRSKRRIGGMTIRRAIPRP